MLSECWYIRNWPVRLAHDKPVCPPPLCRNGNFHSDITGFLELIAYCLQKLGYNQDFSTLIQPYNAGIAVIPEQPKSQISFTDYQRHSRARAAWTLPPRPPWRPSIGRARAPSWTGRTVAGPSPDTPLAVPKRRGEWPYNEKEACQFVRSNLPSPSVAHTCWVIS